MDTNEPTPEQLYLQKERERKRAYYAANREKIAAEKLAKYHERRQKRLENGETLRPRGRPRKD